MSAIPRNESRPVKVAPKKVKKEEKKEKKEKKQED